MTVIDKVNGNLRNCFFLDQTPENMPTLTFTVFKVASCGIYKNQNKTYIPAS